MGRRRGRVKGNGSASILFGTESWSGGVVECWKKDFPEYRTHEAQERDLLSSFRISEISLSIPSQYSNTPILQHSRNLRTGFWPLLGGKSKPRPPSVDSLLRSCASANAEDKSGRNCGQKDHPHQCRDKSRTKDAGQ